MKFLMPKQKIFFDHFYGISEDLKRISALFCELSERFSDFENFAVKAKKIEHDADEKSHAITDLLNKTFITPFDREDIYVLANELDDIVDLIENVIHNIYLYEITEKDTVIEGFADLMRQAANTLDSMIKELAKQKNTEAFQKAKIHIHELEDKGDNLFIKALSALFKSGKDPIFVIKMKDILEAMENTMDKFQKVGDILEGIIVKSS
jgi:hypothetical protein